ncbi:nif-specific transcriptional activator NifA (plasmid) [Sinorhizobium chiapasense]|uniref:Nif-specific regulatory protein n=2 Tax=Sinorhizobium chiapasense TaxID=501572 RepID=A0ABZ2BL97_9HYPH
MLHGRFEEGGRSESGTKNKADPFVSGIYQISKVLTAPTRLEITLTNVVNILSSMLEMRDAAIVVLENETEPEIVATAGITPSPHSGSGRVVSRAAIDAIVATGAPVVIQDASKSELLQPDRQASPSGTTIPGRFIGVPVKAERKILGTLSIVRVRGDTTNIPYDDDVGFLTLIANLVGQTIWLHRSFGIDDKRLTEEQRRDENSPDGERNDIGGRLPAKIDWIVGESPAVKEVLATVSAVAPTNTTVLLRGESGTGKELFAQAIHELSPRRKKPFVRLNCAALPEGVLESELFGHEKGAFTGAISQRAGRFELANGGTLLLDEIGEISPTFQAKLLRVLQEGELERVGGTRTLKVDVRLICATNKNLETAVANGEFRADLYYRINVVPIVLPPLRDRPGDISRLAKVFLKRFNKENGRELTFAPSALDVISQCRFPGNVRELENCVRRTATLAPSTTIVSSDFACKNSQCHSALLWKGSNGSFGDMGSGEPTRESTVSGGSPFAAGCAGASLGEVSSKACDPNDPACPAIGARLTERERLIDAMERSGWVQAKAARLLGLTPRQIGYAIRRYQIEVKKF